MGRANEMNKSKETLKKEDFKDYTYVMVSTLNQMVNYIPFKHFEFKEVYNITIDDSKYADNKKWDNNIKQFVSINEEITFKQNEISDITTIKKRLQKRLKNKKIFWNITGGQRPFILAINQIAKENDVICYLEGNENQMILLQNNNEIKGLIEDYSLEDLNIETALKLMGFEIKETETSHRNFINDYDEKEKDFYLNFLKKYIELIESDKRKDLLKNLMILNKNYPSKKPENTYEERIKKYEKERKEAKEQIKKLLQLDKKYNNILEKELEAKKKSKSTKSFGYILECLAGYKILSIAKDKIADMSLSEKINFSENKVDEYPIDEFDIALLTKNGKFIIFECKSGSMSGDVAKSTKYSTYAVSGVYGLPILITPLLYEEIVALRKEILPQKYQYLKDGLYKNIRKSINSAIRAGLEVWGLDEIEDKFKKYIDLD